ncbi:hypothetical protein ONS95_008105 [Cadophora gregata]|uniref:uncharacterized protein n=1 Tax=Cadophora gregata TaxID=51156 RepID=UPI0026DD1931|nr:uncharacterized protein ONS95_008105 [Cadophora gregata]KAK0119254.1 hypothetical protein ONS96_012313 [Cadophora gregata f. sp. sojae]KAK0126509.1 hypothetical protein ONS95_008105 [Cadophora gregata]
MHTHAISKVSGLLLTYLTFSSFIEALVIRDTAAELSADGVSAISISNAGQVDCGPVGEYTCSASNTTIASNILSPSHLLLRIATTRMRNINRG